MCGGCSLRSCGRRLSPLSTSSSSSYSSNSSYCSNSGHNSSSDGSNCSSSSSLLSSAVRGVQRALATGLREAAQPD